MHRSKLVTVLALILTGCSASSSSFADDPSTFLSPRRPDGCTRTRCDAEYDTCTASKTDRCEECRSTCATIGYEFAIQCHSACVQICSQASSSVCADNRTACEKTERDAVCIDGIDAITGPRPSSPSIGDAPHAAGPDTESRPSSPSWSYSFTSPAETHQDACTDDELRQFADACGAKGSASRCRTFSKSHVDCAACVVSEPRAPAWGPLVVSSSGNTWINSEGCIARVAGDERCAKKIYEANRCLSGCSDANDRNACITTARDSECKAMVTEAESCALSLGVGSSPAYAPCGLAVGDANEDLVRRVITFFCGR